MANLLEYIKQQETAESKNLFTNYASKKALLAANVLSESQTKIVTELKNCFAFAMYTDGGHLVVTMYYNATKTYEYWAIDLTTWEYTSFGTIKEAKKSVVSAVVAAAIASATPAENTESAEENTENTDVEPATENTENLDNAPATGGRRQRK